MGYLKEYYKQLGAIPESDWHFIASCFGRRVFHKGEDIVKLNERGKNLYFIETGMSRYYIPKEDDELTFNFSFEKEFAGAYDSFLSQTPSQYSVQALVKTVSWQISYSSLQDIYDHTKVGNYLGRLFTERLLVMKAQRELSAC
ncbi:Crp/Fnr family transcriptional regulator [Dyadobacter crusticola]|uniref:Crp/Fnr family transcriptional regulator n=1 Tax=Dyadobacter crusticola TaxID=292407 RepID=UPI001E3F5CCD|nr:cyclic nucleotide-binding domain-containing protein [Dyadobacter crusticola]